MTSVDEAVQMSLEEAIKTRRSIRGFLDKPVPPDVLKKVFALAQQAPSNCNAQPWCVFVASGKTRDRIRSAMIKNITGGIPPNPDFHYEPKFEGDYRTRQVECAVALYTEMGIEKGDMKGRMRASLRNFELFDAPHVAFLGMYKDFREPVAVDVGIYLQTLMLVMTAHGIACCAQGSMRSYPDLVRKEFGASDDIRIVVGISFGYEDPSVPANQTITTRADVAEHIAFKN